MNREIEAILLGLLLFNSIAFADVETEFGVPPYSLTNALNQTWLSYNNWTGDIVESCGGAFPHSSYTRNILNWTNISDSYTNNVLTDNSTARLWNIIGGNDTWLGGIWTGGYCYNLVSPTQSTGILYYDIINDTWYEKLLYNRGGIYTASNFFVNEYGIFGSGKDNDNDGVILFSINNGLSYTQTKVNLGIYPNSVMDSTGLLHIFSHDNATMNYANTTNPYNTISSIQNIDTLANPLTNNLFEIDSLAINNNKIYHIYITNISGIYGFNISIFNANNVIATKNDFYINISTTIITTPHLAFKNNILIIYYILNNTDKNISYILFNDTLYFSNNVIKTVDFNPVWQNRYCYGNMVLNNSIFYQLYYSYDNPSNSRINISTFNINITFTTTSSTTTISYEPVVANLSDYYGNITTGLIPEGSSFLGNRADLGRYLIGFFLVVAFTGGAIYVAGMETGLFVGMVVMFILSLATMLPIIIAYIMTIVAVVIIGKEIRNHI